MRKNARLQAAVCRSAGSYKSGLRVSCNRNADSRKTKIPANAGIFISAPCGKGTLPRRRGRRRGDLAAGRTIFFTSGVYFFTDIDKKPRI